MSAMDKLKHEQVRKIVDGEAGWFTRLTMKMGARKCAKIGHFPGETIYGLRYCRRCGIGL